MVDPYKLLQRYIHFEKPRVYVEEEGKYLRSITFVTTDKEAKDTLILYAKDRKFYYTIFWKRHKNLEGEKVVRHFVNISIDKEYDSPEEVREAITDFGEDLLNYIINYKGKKLDEKIKEERKIEDFLEDGKSIEVYLE